MSYLAICMHETFRTIGVGFMSDVAELVKQNDRVAILFSLWAQDWQWLLPLAEDMSFDLENMFPRLQAQM